MSLTNNPDIQKALVYYKGLEEMKDFAELFFPHYCKAPFSSMHEAFFEDERDWQRRGRMEVIAAPRGNAKTTLKVILKTLHAVLYQTDPYILLVCQTASEAQQRVTTVANELRDNPAIHAVFGDVLGRSIRPGVKASFETMTGIKVEAISVRQSPRGRLSKGNRPSLVICDDMESLDSAYSSMKREKLKEWFFKDLMKVGQSNGQLNVIVVGTLLHPDCLLNDLLNSPGWQGHRYQAVLSEAKNQSLWSQWRERITDLTNPTRREAADAFFEVNQSSMLEGARVLWPEVESYKSLMEMRVFEGEAAFLSEKQNDPYNMARMLFDMSQAHFCYIDTQQGVIHYRDETIPLSALYCVAYHDPSEGESESGDYSALVVVGKDKYGRLFVLDDCTQKVPYDEQIQLAYHLKEKWGFTMLLLESNGAQGLFVPLYDKLVPHNHSRLHVVEQLSAQKKQLRIGTLQPLIANGQLIFSDRLSPELMEQMRLFPTASHDDGPDALHGAVAYLLNQSLFYTTRASMEVPQINPSSRRKSVSNRRAKPPRPH